MHYAYTRPTSCQMPMQILKITQVLFGTQTTCFSSFKVTAKKLGVQESRATFARINSNASIHKLYLILEFILLLISNPAANRAARGKSNLSQCTRFKQLAYIQDKYSYKHIGICSRQITFYLDFNQRTIVAMGNIYILVDRSTLT